MSWEYGTALVTPSGEIWDEEPEASLEDAEAHVRTCTEVPESSPIGRCTVVRRQGNGPWERYEPGDKSETP